MVSGRASGQNCSRAPDFTLHMGMSIYLATSSSSNRLVVPPYRLSTIGSQSFPVAAAHIWNSLPDNIVSATALQTFQHFLKTFLFQRSFILHFGGHCSSFYAASSLGGGRIMRRTLSVCPSVCLSVCSSVCPSVPLSLPSVTSHHLANYNDTHVLFGTHRGPHIVRPSRPHKLVFIT